ncbi:carboxypeptidase-like regulatory domain-containing protein [Cytobacillus stercorigallinarum]|nr:hypothetical protein [Cytobacillus stercorigallinarum]
MKSWLRNMKIKLQVKQLVYLVVAFLLLIATMILLIIPQWNIYDAKKQADQGNAEGKVALLETLEDDTVFESQKWNIIQEYMLIQPVEQFNIFAGPSYSQVQLDQPTIQFTWKEKLPYLKQYVKEGPLDDYFILAVKQLTSYYKEMNQPDLAKQTLDQASERTISSSSLYYNDLQLERIDFAINHKEYTEANQLLETFDEKLEKDDYYWHAKIGQRQVEIAMKQGKLQEAREQVNVILNEYKQAEENDDTIESGYTADVYESLVSLKDRIENSINNPTTSTVKGRIMYSDGKPAANVGVILRHESGIHGAHGDERYFTTTDRDGFYEWNFVESGRYQVILGFSFEQIDGWTYPSTMDDWLTVGDQPEVTKDITLRPLIEIDSPVNQEKITTDTVKFSWEPVKGAAYYQLHLAVDIDDGSGSISSSFPSHIATNEIEVPVEEIYDHTVGLSMSGDEPDSVDPLTLLAFANPNNRFSWSVDAFDENDELLTRSNGYRLGNDTIGHLPFFYLKTRTLTEADQLLLDKKFTEALKAYKTNPEDKHSQRMIKRLEELDE